MPRRIRFMAAVWLALSAGLVMGSAPSAGADIGGPKIELSSATAKPGQVLVVTLTGWDLGVVTISVCGNDARRGSPDCVLGSAQSLNTSSRIEPPIAQLPIERPPMPCPCVIRVANTGDDFVQTVPIVLVGVPTAPVIGPDPLQPLLEVKASINDSTSSLVDKLRASLGGRARRTLRLDVKNDGTAVGIGLTVSAAIGRSRASGETFRTPAIDALPPGAVRTVSAPVTLGAPTWGRYVVFGTVAGHGVPVTFATSTSTTPMLLVLMVLGLAADLAAMAWLRTRRRSNEVRLDIDSAVPAVAAHRYRIPRLGALAGRAESGPSSPRAVGDRAVDVRVAVGARRGAAPGPAKTWPVGLSRGPGRGGPASERRVMSGQTPREQSLSRAFRPLAASNLSAMAAKKSAPRAGQKANAPAFDPKVSRTPPSGPGRPYFFQSRKAMALSAIAAVTLVVFVVVAARPSSSKGDKPGESAVPSGPGVSTTASPSPGVGQTGPSTTTLAHGGATTLPVGGAVPASIQVKGTTNVHDGQVVSLHIAADAGSSTYGFDARLCTGGATIRIDADMSPLVAGKCVSKPLSPNSDDYKEVAAQAPYTSVDGTFRVGVGTDHFTLRSGAQASITCGPGHPCEIALKVQYPNGYAFRTFPVTYG